MKNFLIPTVLKEDTIFAVNSAIIQAKNAECEIVLLLVSETPDTYSSAQYLRTMKEGLRVNQREVLQACQTLVASDSNCKLKIHNQFGLSSPILKNIIETFDIKLVILTHTYKQETKRIHQYMVKLARNQKCPILHLGAEHFKYDFNKALYIENETANMHVKDVQEFLTQNFSFEIVSQTKNFHNVEDFTPYLKEAIAKYDIDLLVETRKGEKIKFNKAKQKNTNAELGLPVLSLYEELA